jgi:hypothetical protein
MKRIITLIAALLLATAVLAQEKAPEKEKEFNTSREMKNRIFELKNRSPRTLIGSLNLLGSGFRGANMNINDDLRTITVRDFPENIAAIEDAIKRLDRPVITPDIQMKISVLIGSKTPLPSASVPEDLAPVVKQLQSTLAYSHYGLMTAALQRTTTGNMVNGSGVAEPTILGLKPSDERPIFYSYRLRDVTATSVAEKPAIGIGNFEFSMRVPVNVGTGLQYQSVGFETPVTLRENEKVVIGTTTMGDKALIVVVTAGVQ